MSPTDANIKQTKKLQDVRLAGEQESLPQQAEETIGLLPACFPTGEAF